MISSEESFPPIAVVGLWHLGCTLAASWAKLGHRVVGIDRNENVVRELNEGRPPIYEPDLAESIRSSLDRGTLSFSTAVEGVAGHRFVFVSYDTPVRDDDTSDLSPIYEMVDRLGPFLQPNAIVVFSAQLPAGTSRLLRQRFKQFNPTLEVAYSPENLRLGEALSCYSRPGHIVIGADDSAAGDAVEKLFVPMKAICLRMNLPSAEMTKHAINSFLATSITLSNQWADLCSTLGADFSSVAAALRCDARIGPRAYLTPGIGFSGGTLGRDLRVLDELNQAQAGGTCPIFGAIWQYNRSRPNIVRERCQAVLGSVRERTIALWGMTYKPGTSTLRRSVSLEIAKDLLGHGACIRAYDPKADWNEAPQFRNSIKVCASANEAVQGADILVLLTEWPEFRNLDYARVREAMQQPILFDTRGALQSQYAKLEYLGFTVLAIGRSQQ